ncbi:MAG: TIGR04282 family arsenosugar biosynthesis glycosyltransferase [Isosphaeraceae bacterium]|nr:TIGR04282 family arsenosugar biosynthesis glycosyltransferase [Isosphaeraceae bacterium]
MAWALPEGAVLGIFGKRPEPGKVKTRLAAEFGPEFAAAAHEAMLLDTLEVWDAGRVLAPGGRRVLVFDPPEAGPWFDERVPAAYALQPQQPGDLGQRMGAFCAGEFEDGATRVVLIGSDSPTLDPTIVISAFLCLEGRDVVLGPSTDGGYYLVGCRPPVPPIFEGIDWSTPHVLGQTIDRLHGTGLSLAVLPPWYDIDSPNDWQMLAGHIKAMRRAGMDPGLPRIERLIHP